MIDWHQINVLRNEVGPEDFDEVVALFLDEVEEVTDRLAMAPRAETLESDLHFLKGSALSLGFREFSTRCQTGETLSSQGKPELVDLPALLECYRESKARFLGELPGALSG